MEDNFDSLDYNTWHMEEQVSWENGNFDWTTKNERNASVFLPFLLYALVELTIT